MKEKFADFVETKKVYKCAECNYYGYNEDGFPCCLADPRWPAPCEEEDDYEESDDIDDDFGFDPYEGCYTYDC